MVFNGERPKIHLKSTELVDLTQVIVLRRTTTYTTDDGIEERNWKLAYPAKLLSYHQKTDVCQRVMEEQTVVDGFHHFVIHPKILAVHQPFSICETNLM